MSPAAGRISLLIVDDHPAIARGLGALLGDVEDLAVQTAFDVATAEAILSRDHPTVALCDIVLDGTEAGFDLLGRFGGQGGTAFIMFSAHDVSGFYARAVRLGAVGFVPKTASAEEILAAVRRAAGGVGSPDPRTLRRARLAPPEPTARELEIIRLVVVGLQNQEIATELAVGRKTVESHLRRLFDRYDVRSRTELATLAHVEGWVGP